MTAPLGLEVTYYRTGPIRPSVVTSSPGAVSPSDFGSLELTNVIKVTLDFGNGTTIVFFVSTENVVTVQQVVDAVNVAYQAATLASSDGTEFNRASVPVPVPGPHVFSDPSVRDSFFVSFNGNTPIHINPPAGEYSASSFATYVNNQIGAASQVAEGEAVALSLFTGDPVRTVFRSKSFSGGSSSVRFYPGNPGGSIPGSFMETLNYLGLTPGLYKGTVCASLYGLDEIELFCPSTLPGASITVEAQSPSASTVPDVTVILPEMVEFHEEPDNYDTEIQDFDNRGDAATIDPSLGVGNVGLSALLGLTGKIDPSFIPGVLDALNLNQLNLGANRIKSATDQRAPRAVYPYNPSFGAVLLWEGVDMSEPSTNGLLRMYLKEGDVYLARNAKLSAAGTWDRDVALLDSSMFEFRSGKGSFAVYPGASAVPWSHNDWQRNIAFNPFAVADAPYGDGLLKIGEFANTAAALKPRLDIPTQLSVPTLLFAAKASTGVVIRAYVTNTTLASTAMLEITVNASFNGSQWAKDITGQQATRFDFTAQGGFRMSTRAAANDAAWSVWDALPVQFDPAGMVNYFQYTLKLGYGATQANLPRVSADRYSASTNRRTLLFESPITEANTAVPIRVYLDTANTVMGDGFQFTYNARWDQALDKWVQDVPSTRSNAWLMGAGRFWLFSKASGSAPWFDSYVNWDTYDLFDRLTVTSPYSGVAVRDGTFRVDSASSAVSNPPSATAVISNAVYAKSMVKAWGYGIYQTGNAVVVDGFNFAWIGQNGAGWDTGFAGSMAHGTIRGFIGTVGRRDTSGYVTGGTAPCVHRPHLTNWYGQMVGYFLDFNGNLYPQASLTDMSWVAFSQT